MVIVGGNGVEITAVSSFPTAIGDASLLVLLESNAKVPVEAFRVFSWLCEAASDPG